MEPFDIRDVFGVAKRMEADGARFYKESARRVPEPLSGLLLEFAAEEEQHFLEFDEMARAPRSEVEPSAAFDTPEEAEFYRRVLASGYVFDVEAAPYEGAEAASAESILTWAVAREKDAAVFYAMVKELAPAASHKDIVGEIMKTELSHVRVLSEQLARLKEAAR